MKDRGIIRKIKRLYEALTTAYIWIGALILGIVGFLLMLNYSALDWYTFRRELGALLLVTAIVTLVWNFVQKRSFLDEVLSKVGITSQLMAAGIIEVHDSFEGVDWRPYFSSANELEIFFAYGRSWRRTHRRELQKMAANRLGTIRVILPNPEDQATMSELGRRFNSTAEGVSDKVREAVKFFQELTDAEGGQGAKIELRFLDEPLLFSVYRFDKRVAIMALFSHQGDEYAVVPAFVCVEGGTLFRSIAKELGAVIEKSHPI